MLSRAGTGSYTLPVFLFENFPTFRFKMREIKWIVIHCTAGPQWQTVESILNYWKTPKPNGPGWNNPGYHHMVKADGTIVDLQPIEKPSNGVAGYNAHAIHISYIGGVEIKQGFNDKGKPINVIGRTLDNRTNEQKQAINFLILKYHREYPNAIIQGHRDFSPDKNRDGVIMPDEWIKACPSYSVRSELHCLGIMQ